MSIGNKIREIRKTHGFSQQQFAERYGVTRQTVSNWENDKHYPDMEILKQISNDFDVSFDTLLKDDKIYIETIDKGMKKLVLWKKLLIFLVVVIVSLVILIFAFLHIAFRGTPDGDRIKTDTDARMVVSLLDSAPSKAITRTYDAEIFEGYSETKKTKLRSETAGRLEGDVPHVSIEDYDSSWVGFVFQDSNCKNIEPIIEKVTLYTSNGMPVTPIKRTDKKLKYKYENGMLKVFLSEIFKESELAFSESQDALMYSDDAEETRLAVWFCIFEVKYSIGDKEYVSLSSVTL